MATKTVTWTKAFSVGITEVDNQHQKLFEMINDLSIASKSGDRKRSIEKVLENMASYVEYHFNTEKCMLKNLPNFEQHNHEHWLFTKKTMLFIKNYQVEKDHNILAEMSTFLVDWLTDHILKTDIQQFAQLAESTKLN